MANHGTFHWNELATTDVDGANRLLKNSSHLALYRDSFGLKTEGG